MRRFVALFVYLAIWAVASLAQVVTGTILGSVTDPSGGAIAGANVSILNLDTNVKTVLSTNADGQYTRPLLPPGRYEVTVTASGFATFTRSNIELSVDAQFRVDAHLGMASSSQSVQVSASADVLQTDASDLSQTINRTAVEDLPNVNGNPLYFAITIPGIVPIDSTRGNFMDPDQVGVGDNSRVALTSFSVNGGQPATSNIQLDGALNTGAAFNEIAVMPSLDAVGEVHVITNNYSAEYGRAGGGVIAIQTKAGGNQFHGTLHEYVRNSAFNANTFGNNSFGRDASGNPLRPKAPFATNNFGGTFSGPIHLPKLYNGHDRTFFFFSYEGLRRSQGTNSYYTVPTALERKGDFSQTVAQVLAPNGQTMLTPVQVFLPFPDTTTINTIKDGVYQLNRQQASYNGVPNVIPPQYLNATGLKLINNYPMPNIPPLNADGTKNYFTNAPAHTRTDQIIAKIDHNFSGTERGFFRWTTDWTHFDPTNIFAGTNPAANNSPPITQFNPTATFGYTATLNSSSIVDLRANVTRINLSQEPAGIDLSALGFSPQEVASAATSVFPLIGGTAYPQQGLSRYAYESNHSTNYAFSGSYTKLMGKWTHKVGGEYTALLYNFFQPTVNSLYFNAIGAGFSSGCSGTGCPSLAYNNVQGSAAANLIMGALDGGMNSGQFATADPAMALKNGYWAVYDQSDWKATRNLTVNLGIRWEFQGPMTDRYDRLSQFDLSAVNTTGTQGLYMFSGRDGVPRGQHDADWHDFAPRVGLAYRLGPKTVIRTAYGISYIMTTGVGSGAQGFGTDGFLMPSYVQIRPNSGIATGLDILQNVFTNAFSKGGTTTGTDPMNPAYLGTATVTAILRNHSANPYIQQWNFTIQRQLPASLILTTAYVGTKGTRLILNNFGLNQIDDVPNGVLQSARETYHSTGIDPLSVRVPNPFYNVIFGNTTLSQSTIVQRYLYEPYPAYGQIYDFNDRAGSSIYHALQVTVQRSFKQGFQFNGNFTWSKSMDFGGNLASSATWGQAYYSPTNAGLDRAVSGNNPPRRVVLSFVAELPFGHGKPLLATTPIARQIMQGWKVSGVAIFSDGFPLSITGGSNIGYNNGGRPNLVGNPVLPAKYQVIGDGKTAYPLPDGRTIVVPAGYKLYFNPDAFSVPVVNIPTASGGNQWVTDVYWYGTSPRLLSDLHGPGTNNWDMNLSRTFHLGEKMKLDFRLDSYNAMNRVKFGNPASGFGSANLTSPTVRGMSTSSTFGMISTATQSNFPRYLQLTARLVF